MIVAFDPAAPKALGALAENIELVANAHTKVSVPGTALTVYEQDRVVARTTNTVLEATFDVDNIALGNPEPMQYESKTPGVCSVDYQTGEVSQVTNGVCTIAGSALRGAAWGSREVTQAVSKTSSATVNTVRMDAANPAYPNSLRRHLVEVIYGAITGKTPGAATQVQYSSLTKTAPYAAIKNTALFLPDLDLDCVNFTGSNGYFVGIFISRRHMLHSWHTEGAYASVTVRRNDGTFQTLTRVSRINLGADLGISYYSTDVTGIAFATLPAEFDLDRKIPGLRVESYLAPSVAVPFLTLRMNPGQSGKTGTIINSESRKLIISHLVYSLSNVAPVPGFPAQIARNCTSMQWTIWPEGCAGIARNWGSAIYGGDSSSPMFLPIAGVPVFFSMHYSASGGPWLPSFVPVLPAIMNSMATAAGESNPNYTLRIADLSSFTDFT